MNPNPASPPANPAFFWKECGLTLRLAVPLVMGQLAQMLMGVVDTVMIGRLGTVPLAASAFANSLLMVPLVFGVGVLSSVSMKTAQAGGAGDHGAGRSALRSGLWLATGLGLAVVAGFALLLPWLGGFGQPEEVVRATPGYLMTCAVSLLPALTGMALKNQADALNFPWPPFWIMLGGVALNAVLNALWIYGQAGFPALGLEGAGYATLTARTVTTLALLGWMGRSPALRAWMPWTGTSKKPPRRDAGGMAEELRLALPLLRLGLPAGLHLLAEVSMFMVAALLVGFLGVVPMAAHQVTLTCASVTFMIPLGISMALTVRVGELTGAGRDAMTRRHAVLLGGWGLGWLAALGSMGLFFGLGREVAAGFTRDPAVVAAAAPLLIIAGFFQLGDATQVISAGALRGVHDVRFPARLALLTLWGVALPVSWVLGFPLGLGSRGVWIGLAAGLGVAGVVLGLRAWRQLGAKETTPGPGRG